MKRGEFFLAAFVVSVLLAASDPSTQTAQHRLKTGWVIGDDESGSAVILHTQNGGKKWRVQGDSAKWPFAGTG